MLKLLLFILNFSITLQKSLTNNYSIYLLFNEHLLLYNFKLKE